MSTRVIVDFLTGFLGAGKTSLLNEVLSGEARATIGVLLNEAGAIDLERHMLAKRHPSTGVVELANGCLCCLLDRDLEAALLDLIAASRSRPREQTLERIVVETSGLADPFAMMETILQSARLDPVMTIGTVTCLVASDFGGEALRRHPEARQQLAAADAIVVTRSDLKPFDSALEADIRRHSLAPIVQRSDLISERKRNGSKASRRPLGRSDHSSGLISLALALATTPSYLDFCQAVATLLRKPGGQLLRLKAITEFSERPGAPAFIQGVRASMGLPTWLSDWPSEDRRSRLLITAQNISASDVLSAFEVNRPSVIGHRAPAVDRARNAPLSFFSSPLF